VSLDLLDGDSVQVVIEAGKAVAGFPAGTAGHGIDSPRVRAQL
jgi:hypothetical protein